MSVNSFGKSNPYLEEAMKQYSQQPIMPQLPPKIPQPKTNTDTVALAIQQTVASSQDPIGLLSRWFSLYASNESGTPEYASEFPNFLYTMFLDFLIKDREKTPQDFDKPFAPYDSKYEVTQKWARKGEEEKEVEPKKTATKNTAPKTIGNTITDNKESEE